MAKTPEPTFSSRVATLRQLRDQLARIEANISEEERQLIQLGAGRYTDGEDFFATVIAETAAGSKFVALTADDADKAREIAGESFAELFERTITFTPKSGFADRADALLTAAPRRRLFELCEKPTPARAASVRYKSA